MLAVAGLAPILGAGSPPAAIPADHVVIEAAGNGIEVRLPSMKATVDRATLDHKAGTRTLDGSEKEPVVLTESAAVGRGKKHTGPRLVIYLKDGTVETVAKPGR